jgi:hypothetical protein
VATENRSDSGREEGKGAIRHGASALCKTGGAATPGACEGVNEERTAMVSRMAVVVAWIASRSDARARPKPSVIGGARAPDLLVRGQFRVRGLGEKREGGICRQRRLGRGVRLWGRRERSDGGGVLRARVGVSEEEDG